MEQFTCGRFDFHLELLPHPSILFRIDCSICSMFRKRDLNYSGQIQVNLSTPGRESFHFLPVLGEGPKPAQSQQPAAADFL
jgi:hypothetical protein